MIDTKAIVSIVDKITKVNEKPCKKALQKIVFLIEAKGVDIGCNYGIHFYGPYSADLDFAIRELCDRNVLNIEYTSTNHIISVNEDTIIENCSNETINHVVDTFGRETPSELELISTALYVYLKTRDKDKIVAGVQKIKGKKYSEDRIQGAISKLENDGYLVA